MSFKKYENLASILLARLVRYCTKSCTYLASLAVKMKPFYNITRYKKILQESCKKICKIILLKDMIKSLQENCLANFSCKILARFFISCKKSLIFSAKLARFMKAFASLARKVLARFGCFLLDDFCWNGLQC